MESDADDEAARDVIEKAVAILRRTNRCDAAAARAILRSTADRNRLAEVDVARTLVALSATPRRASRPMR